MTRANDLLNSFSETRKKVTSENSQFIKANKSRPKKKKHASIDYNDKIKSGDLESITINDLMYFFRDKARENGVMYVIANFKKDLRIFKLAKEREYSNEDIMLMIEFLFVSDQDYLDKKSLHPGILLTGWCNKIYQDSQLWLNDEYVNTKNTKKKSKQTREWKEEIPKEDTATIGGEWGI